MQFMENAFSGTGTNQDILLYLFRTQPIRATFLYNNSNVLCMDGEHVNLLCI